MADTADLYGERTLKSTAPSDDGNSTTTDGIAAAWNHYSERLAAWAWERLVNRADAWGGYKTTAVVSADGLSTTTKIDPTTIKTPVTAAGLLNHFNGSAIRGLHAIGLDGTSKWLGIDIDAHGDVTTAKIEANEAYAIAMFRRLSASGFNPFLESNKRGGYHLWLLFDRPITGEAAYRVGLALRADYKAHEHLDEPESFPKRADRGSGGYGGGWLRIPGRHHKRDEWAKVFDGSTWLEGDEACRYILSLNGDDPERLPAEWTNFRSAKELEATAKALLPRPTAKPYSGSIGQPGGGRAGDDYNERGDVRELLLNHKWQPCGAAGNREYWTRPGKCGGSTSASLTDSKVFYCFSKDAGLEADQGYSPFALFAALEHNNDYRAAAKALYALGYGEKDKPKLREELPIVPVATADESTASITLDQYRSAMRDAVIDRPHEAGCFALSAPPGVGKTTLLRELVMKRLEAGHDVLSLLPVHANIDEELAKCREALPVGKTAEKYPPRKCVEEFGAAGGNLSDLRHVDTEQSNCQNPLANFVDECGLSVLQSVCNMGCPHRSECAVSGWLAERDKFKAANLKLATHKLAEMVGLEELAKECSVIIADEDPRSMLRPIDEVTLENVRHARKDLREVLDDPTVLSSDWLNPTTEDGDQAIADKATLEAYLRWLDSTVFDSLVEQLEAGALLTELSISRWQGGDVRKLFPFVFRKLNSTKWRSAIGKPTKSPWPCLYRATLDRGTQTAELFSKVHESFKPAPNPTREKIELRSLVTVRRNPPPVNVEMWFLDGTSGPNLEVLVGRPVLNLTPSGRIPRKHPATQYTKDITHRTSPDVVVSLLRGFFGDHPEIRKLGVFCHQQNRAMIEGLNDPRIAVDPFDDKMIGHFNSGVGRSSNKWHECCDAILILGSSRTGPEPVRLELLRLGRLEAAAMPEPPWVRVNFKARDQQGRDVLFEGGRYADDDWQAAHNSLCRVELLQTIGRGRGELDEGVPVFVFSNEPIGIPISDGQPDRINSVSDHCLAVLRDHRGDSEDFPKEPILGISSESPLRTSVVAQRVTDRIRKADPTAKPVSERTVNTYLRDLEARGLVFRRGNRGWLAVIDPQPSETPKTETPQPVIAKTTAPNAPESTQKPFGEEYVVRTSDGVLRPLGAICEELGVSTDPDHSKQPCKVVYHRGIAVLSDCQHEEKDDRVLTLIDEKFAQPRQAKPLACYARKGWIELLWADAAENHPDFVDFSLDGWNAFNRSLVETNSSVCIDAFGLCAYNPGDETT